MGYSFKGSIAFGLIYIPVTLENAVLNNDISFRMLDKETKTRVKYKKTAAENGGKELQKTDIVKGYEYEKGRYVIFTDEELDKLKTPKDKSISIERFVDGSQIDPIYYDKPFFVNPTGGEKAYALLAKAMEEADKIGIAKTVVGNKENLIAIRARGGKIFLNTMFFYEEIKKNSVSVNADVNEKELELAKSVINAMSGEFEPQSFRDEYRARLMDAIEAKIAGKEIETPEARPNESVGDIMDALQKMLDIGKVGGEAKESITLEFEDKEKLKSPKKKKSPESRAEA